MGENSGISWCDNTFNPWLGCLKVSPGCNACYAESFVTGRMKLPVWGPSKTTERKRTSAANWKKPLAWNRAAAKAGKCTRVFCASLADVFEDHPQVAPWRVELFALIEATPHLDWQLLTKRPENLQRFLPQAWLEEPLPHVWLGTTVEDQKRANERIPHLLATPASVRFLSCEPLLEAVDLNPPRCQYCRDGGEVVEGDPPWCVRCDSEAVFGHWLDACASPKQPGINWVIVGGESGPGARPFNVEWAEFLLADCELAKVPCFIKQMGSAAYDPREAGPGDEVHPQGAAYDPDCRLPLSDRSGADPEEWGEHLRVQQFPEVSRG